MKKSIIISIIVILLVIGGMVVYKNMTNQEEPIDANATGEMSANQEQDKLVTTEDLYIVPTMLDELNSDTIWCATFQLVWNDMKNDVVKQDIVFNPQIDIAKNLNKEEFTEDMISDEYFFKIYGLKTLELKAEIEEGIKQKFNETSDLLEDFDWSEDGLDDPNNQNERRYFFYAMLRRSFEFLYEFDELENGAFGSNYDDIKYFGIEESSREELGSQIEVLYYNSEDDFAIIINTKQDDEVIFCKNPKGSNFKEIYDNMLDEADKYKGDRDFKDIDELKIPSIKLNEKKEYDELADKPFPTADPIYPEAVIVKAIQTIQFELNRKGGEIKSEAAIDMIMKTSVAIESPKPRTFYVDDTFTIFLREKGREMPYFAGIIKDITKFQ